MPLPQNEVEVIRFLSSRGQAAIVFLGGGRTKVSCEGPWKRLRDGRRTSYWSATADSLVEAARLLAAEVEAAEAAPPFEPVSFSDWWRANLDRYPEEPPPGTEDEECDECDGAGTITDTCEFDDEHERDCSACEGSGRFLTAKRLRYEAERAYNDQVERDRERWAKAHYRSKP